jgi:nitroreductase family protein
MTSTRPGNATVLAALELAVRAPSLHNTQPWRWRVGDESVQLYLDQARQLPATDPEGRELIISCGAALHHLLVACSSLGWSGRLQRLPDPTQPACLAHVQFSPRTPPRADADLAAAIPRRRTDRRRFTSWPVPAELIGELSELAAENGMTLRPITEPELRWKTYRAIAEAAGQQTTDPAQAAELAAWSGRDPCADDGVPTANVPQPGRVPGQPPMREFAQSELDQPPTHGEPEAAALLLLSTPADTPLQWLRAGELTSAILLAATRDGLAASPLTQPLEIADTREFLRTQIAGTAAAHPQILLRIGWTPPAADELHPTPRRPLAEVIAPIDDWRDI